MWSRIFSSTLVVPLFLGLSGTSVQAFSSSPVPGPGFSWEFLLPDDPIPVDQTFDIEFRLTNLDTSDIAFPVGGGASVARGDVLDSVDPFAPDGIGGPYYLKDWNILTQINDSLRITPMTPNESRVLKFGTMVPINDPTPNTEYNIPRATIKLRDGEQVRSTNDFVFTTAGTTAKAAIHLDFASSTYRDNVYVSLPDGSTGIVETADFAPAEVFDDPGKIVGLVDDIFKRSNLEVDVITDASRLGDYESTITVEFHEPIADSLGTYGSAAGDALKFKVFPDRFDRKKSGAVKLFMSDDPNVYDSFWPDVEQDELYNFIAKVAVHEAGHGFGLNHIQPTDDGVAVMSYGQNPEARLWGEPSTIVSFSNIDGPLGWLGDSSADAFAATRGQQNSQYHMRRYALGQDPDTIELEPGRWDTGTYEMVKTDFELGLGSAIDLFITSSDTLHGDAHELINLSDLMVGGILELELPFGEEFSIFGSSQQNNIFDLALGLGDHANFTLSLDALKEGMPLGLFSFDTPDAMPVKISQVGVNFGETYIYGDDGSRVAASTLAPVPLPASVWFLVVALMMPFGWRRLSPAHGAVA